MPTSFYAVAFAKLSPGTCTDTCDNTSFYGCTVAFHQVHFEQKLSLTRAKELSIFKGCVKRSNHEQRDQKELCGMTSPPLYEYYTVLPHYSEPLLLLLQTEQGWSLP